MKNLIDELIADTKKIKSEVLELAKLGADELHHKPGPNKWNILECIEHLNIADSIYLYQFEKKLTQGSASRGQVFKPGILGNLFVTGLKPKSDGTIPNRMKTFQKFLPEVNAKYDTINKFLEDQDRLIQLLDASRKLDLNRNRIATALGRLVTLNLGDAYRFVIAHNQRHVVQMKNILKEYKG